MNSQSAKKRLTRFFSSLYGCLKRTAKVILSMMLYQYPLITIIAGKILLIVAYPQAALQFYPETPEQVFSILLD